MTDFQLGLVLMGAVAVAGVLIYNRLQERTARRQAEEHFSSGHADALFESASPRREPTPSAAASVVRQREEAGEEAPRPSLPDERIDYVIDVSFATPVHASEWMEAWRPLERRFKQNLLLAASHDALHWRTAGGHGQEAWAKYRAGLQLVSRKGMVAEGEVLEFRSTIEGVTASLDGTVEPTDLRQAIERAHELDAFCADSDIQVAFHLVTASAANFSPEAVRRAAADAGMEEGSAGFRMRDASDLELFSLSPADLSGGESDRLTFSLDVPRTEDVRRAYRTMVSTAQQLRSALGGSLVDDNGTALDERALEAIWRSIEPIIQSLEKNGVTPGSQLALRLFS